MRVVLATVGTRGDVQPMLALAQALTRRGHHAIVACPDSFAPWVRSFGVEHRALGEDLQALMAEKGASFERSLASMKSYFREQLLQQAPALLDITRGADAIVGTAMAWMAPSVAEKLGIPALELLPTSCAPSRLHPPPLMPFYGLPQWLNALLWWTSDHIQNGLMGAPVNEARATLALPPIASFTSHLFVDVPAVIAADDTLLPPDPAWNGRYPYAGFLFLDDPAPLDPALDAWLAKGEPPIHVGFGSMAGGHPERVVAVLHDVARATGRRVLVAAGSAKLGALPEELHVVRDAPHAKLFPRVAVAVHHGGSGTTAAALRAGVPQVVLPMMLDQFHHAHHLARAGLAPKAPSMAKVTAKTLVRAIEEALALPDAPRRAMSERLRASDAGNVIVDRLEQMTRARA
ncbi:glycosyltransferase [Sandaracinus amylolyticus]|uniref:Putative glycosyltransferase n=1 Tax=Sandaracinus amylolyticus TaxID=927083 RepID=A0A0F6YN37_9BACT|nr:glycosyltransferase [Sandaracinus amylolyticus]AKF10838.1 putative glycosyltransferase [Sandaracinus amylolyticus]